MRDSSTLPGQGVFLKDFSPPPAASASQGSTRFSEANAGEVNTEAAIVDSAYVQKVPAGMHSTGFQVTLCPW